MVSKELPTSDSTGLLVLRELLNFIDSFTVIMFSVEIVLKWIDNFKSFWRNPWNVFDLFVTVLVRIVRKFSSYSIYLAASFSCLAATPFPGLCRNEMPQTHIIHFTFSLTLPCSRPSPRPSS